MQKNKTNLKITRKDRGLTAKPQGSSPSSVQGRTEGGRRPVRPSRCRSGALAARVRCRIGRGDRGGLEDVLTTGGDRRRRPESTEDGGGVGGRRLGFKGRRRTEQGEARGGVGSRGGRRTAPPFIGARDTMPPWRARQGKGRRRRRGGHGLWLGHMGLAGPGYRAGGCGSERVGPTGSAQKDMIGFLKIFRIYF
jgi:hypothetical protein